MFFGLPRGRRIPGSISGRAPVTNRVISSLFEDAASYWPWLDRRSCLTSVGFVSFCPGRHILRASEFRTRRSGAFPRKFGLLGVLDELHFFLRPERFLFSRLCSPNKGMFLGWSTSLAMPLGPQCNEPTTVCSWQPPSSSSQTLRNKGKEMRQRMYLKKQTLAEMFIGYFLNVRTVWLMLLKVSSNKFLYEKHNGHNKYG